MLCQLNRRKTAVAATADALQSLAHLSEDFPFNKLKLSRNGKAVVDNKLTKLLISPVQQHKGSKTER